MATGREDLVWAAILHYPCYDSADVVVNAENTQDSGREYLSCIYLRDARIPPRIRWDKEGLKNGDLLSVWRGLAGTALIRQTEF